MGSFASEIRGFKDFKLNFDYICIFWFIFIHMNSDLFYILKLV